MKKKLVSMLLVAAMTASLCACNGTANESSADSSDASQASSSATVTESSAGGQETVVTPSIAWADMEYDEASAYVYDAALGEFYDIYQKAASAKSDSESYALQALAEAKLLEACVMLPSSSC